VAALKTPLAILASVALGFCLPFLGFELFGFSLGFIDPPDWAYRDGSKFFPLLRLSLLVPLVVATAYVITRLTPASAALMGSLAVVGGLLALAVQFFSSPANQMFTLADVAHIVWPEVTPLVTLPFVCVIWRRRAA
jgi:hypothetical protein